MKQTITLPMFRDAFKAVRPNQFSYEALEALFDFYSELERDTGEESELDVVAICCDWAEYSSALEAAECHGWKSEEAEEGQREAAALEWLQEQTQAIELNGSVLVLNF